MSFPRLSRRRLLAGGGSALAVSLAGCAGTSESSSVSVDDDDTFESTHEYETHSIRGPDESLFVFPEDDAADSTKDRPESTRYSTVFVTDRDDAAALRIDTDAERAAGARAFVEATDFEAESVVVDQRRIDDCYRRTLESVRASDDKFQTQYCRTLKGPRESCEADKTLTEAVFIRVGRPYADRPSTLTSGERASCARPNMTSSRGTESSSEASNDLADREEADQP